MESHNVFVFPCVSRSTGDDQKDLTAKLMSEKNITNIIKSITDNKSYVISWDNGILKCIINGYYFEVNETKEKTKYAQVVMKSNAGFAGDIIEGDDVSGFGGLEITTSRPSGEYLLICENGIVPATSRIKFSPDSVNIDALTVSSIDCGELK